MVCLDEHCFGPFWIPFLSHTARPLNEMYFTDVTWALWNLTLPYCLSPSCSSVFVDALLYFLTPILSPFWGAAGFFLLLGNHHFWGYFFCFSHALWIRDARPVLLFSVSCSYTLGYIPAFLYFWFMTFIHQENCLTLFFKFMAKTLDWPVISPAPTSASFC